LIRTSSRQDIQELADVLLAGDWIGEREVVVAWTYTGKVLTA